MKKSKSTKNGDCYEAAGRYMTDHMSKSLVLVHGEVEGQGPLKGVRFGHAWIEDGDNVIEVANGNHLVLPKLIYYSLGNIDWIKNYHKYDMKQFTSNLVKYGTWGPWNLKTSSGL